jgi:hypothetical protein
VRCAELRGDAVDEHGIEPSDFPTPWREVAAHILLHPEADLHALTMLEVVQQHPEVHAAVYRWSNTELAMREPAIMDAGEALREGMRSLRVVTLQEDLKRLTFQINQAEKERDFARASALSLEKRDAHRRLNDLQGRSGFSEGGP